MVALYEPEKKWLFSADLYINSRISYFLKNESIRQQIQSIRKVLELDFDVMFCGHNPQLTKAKVKLGEKLNYLEGFVSKVSRFHGQGNSAKEILRCMNQKELTFLKVLSGGELSKINMVRSVIRDYF